MAAGNTPLPSAPKDRDKALSVAYLRLLGATQEEAASAAGVGERTIRDWERCDWWREVKAEAMDRWLDGLRSKTLMALDNFVGNDPTTARWAAERIFGEFVPPAQRTEITGKDGEPLGLNIETVRAKIAKRLEESASDSE